MNNKVLIKGSFPISFSKIFEKVMQTRLLEHLHLLPLISQYIISLLIFLVNNRDQFHKFIIQILDFSYLDKYRYLSKRRLLFRFWILNSLPFNIKKLSDNPMTLKMCSKMFIYELLLFIR